MVGTVFLDGERVSLHPIEHDDINFLQQSHNRPELRKGLLYSTPHSYSQVEKILEEEITQDETRVDLLIYTGEERAGVVSLFNISSNREHGTLSYWLLPEYQGSGYTTEAVSLLLDYAFNTLRLHHIIAWTIAYNEPSQALLQRVGFTQEGIYREHIFRKGEYHDTVHYGILRKEWKE